MLFTQEDYKKIENWLKARAIKDSEFIEASSLDGDEYVVIVQNGENKKVTIESIVKTFFGENGSSVYTSSIKDKNTEMPVDIGDLKAGTTVGELEGLTFSELFDRILFSSLNPTFVNPSIKFNLVGYSTIVEVGSKAPSIENFVVNFDRGGIYLGDEFQNYRAGELNNSQSFIYVNNNESLGMPEIIEGGNTVYRYKASYTEGPQPINSRGGAYGSPLPAGSITSSPITITGIYPWFATTAGATANTLVKQPLKKTNTYSDEFTLQSAALCEQIIETPEEITELKVKEPMSGNFIVSTLDKYIKTTVTKTINGVSKTYYRYTYDVDTNGYRGEVTLKIKF